MSTSFYIAHIGYLTSISLFVFGIKRLSKVRTGRSGNAMAAVAMLLAIVSQLIELGHINYALVLAGMVIGGAIGAVMATKVQMTAMPQMVAVFNGFGGAASALVALSLFFAADKSLPIVHSLSTVAGESDPGVAVTVVLSILIGAVTFSGSMLAYLKLSEVYGKQFSKPYFLPSHNLVLVALLAVVIGLSAIWIFTATSFASVLTGLLLTLASLVLGILVVCPIGGADMPVVVSLLNSYSGLAASATGFVLHSPILIVSGALVGASGLILTNIMCKGMNRSLLNVMAGGVGGETSVESQQGGEYVGVKSADAEEAAIDFESASSVIIVPGYGLAAAQGQNALAEFAKQLKALGCKVRYAIHPVAGRMPGHMNVLLAESSIPYDELFEMSDINEEFRDTDIALIVGANDVVNPSAKTDTTSPLYGMPVLNVEQARMVFVIKRSLNPGFTGIKNTLFEMENTRMIYGDAKKVLEEMTNYLDESKS